jgi:hypothetical protein
MKNQVRIMAFFLLITAILQSSCGKTATDTPSEQINDSQVTTHLDTVDPASVLELPDIDWKGREFRVLGYEQTSRTQFSNFEIYSEGENGDVVNDAIFRRNSQVEEKYNVKIVQFLNNSQPSYDICNADHIRKTVLAQEDLYDLTFTTICSYGTLAREGFLYDLNNINYIDFSKNYWNPEVNKALSFDNRLFFTSSDFSLRDKSRAYILLYNRDMANEYKLGNPVELVNNGTWTIDVMTKWSKSVANDLNGNGAVDDQDQFGLAMDSYNAFATLMAACGNIMLTKNSSDKFVLTMNNEHTVNSIDKILELVGVPSEAIFCNDWNGKVDYDHWSVASKSFKSGRSLFITCFPHSLKGYSADCNFEYGIIPYPKYDEKQEKYYTMADDFCMLFSIPISNPNPDFTGFMLEALSYASTNTSLKAYYEISCKTKYTYDEDSANMLDLIFSNIIYEPAKVFKISNIANLYSDIAKAKTNNFSSLYASAESAALADLEKLSADLSKVK